MNKDRKHTDIVTPTILISLGAILLLNNMGYINWSFWDILSLWPILLVAAGLEILIGKRSTWGAVITAALVVLLVIGGGWLVSSSAGGRLNPPATLNISEPRHNITAVRAFFAPTVGQLNVTGLNDSGNLIEGTVEYQRNEEVKYEFKTDPSPELILEAGNSMSGVRVVPRRRNTWQLSFHPDVALDLQANMAVGNVQLYLTTLTVNTADVEFGMGQVVVRLPETGDFDMHIAGGIGTIVIEVPDGMAVRIETDAAMVTRDISINHTRQGDIYETPDYAGAENRADVRLGLGIGGITVRAAPGQ